MKVTFSGIGQVEKYAKDADIFICLADANWHPCTVKKYETEWAKKVFIQREFNDRNIDMRYKEPVLEDIEFLGREIQSNAVISEILKERDGKESWMHINCLAGISRSAAITLLVLLLIDKNKPTLKSYQKYHAEIANGVYRVPSHETYPNGDICKLIRQYFNLEVIDGEFTKKQ
jgi:predicted protein tyrosine phosphatase